MDQTMDMDGFWETDREKEDILADVERVMNEIRTCCLEKEYDRGLSLFEENQRMLKNFGDEDYTLLCSAMAVLLESYNQEEAVWFADEAMRGLAEYESLFTREKVWEIRYDHHIFHFLYKKEGDYEGELLSLYNEVSEEAEVPDGDLGIMLLKILYFILSAHAVRPEMTEYLSLAEEFYRITAIYEDRTAGSLLNRRCAAYYMAQVYLSRGELMPAEQYLKETVSLEEVFPNALLDFYGLQKLAMVYYMQSNYEQAVPVAEKLADLMDSGEQMEEITQNELQVGVVLLSNIYAAAGENRLAAEVVREPLEEGIIYPEQGKKYITYVYDMAVYRTIAYYNGLPPEYRAAFAGYMRDMECSDAFLKLTNMDMAEHYAVKALLYWHMGDLSVLRRLEYRFDRYMKNAQAWEGDAYYFPCLIIAAINMMTGRTDTAVSFARRMVIWNEKRFSRAMVYQNRKRLSDFCQNGNKIFYAAYSVYRGAGKTGACYDLLLNYKNMESLLTVYRNRITDELDGLKSLSEEINSLLDIRAGIRMSEQLGQEDGRREKIEKELEEKEYLFSRQMSGDYEFTPFRAKEVLEKMPDDSAYIEYLFFLKDYYLSILDAEFHEEAEYQLDVYFFVKKGGTVKKKCFSIPDLAELAKEMTFYLSEMEKRHHKKIERSRQVLYYYLISHIEKELKGVKNIYIAPDGNLCNLPFHVLEDGEGVMLGEKCRVIMIDTGRDFLRRSPEAFASHFTVVGNPAYDYTGQSGASERTDRGRKGFLEAPVSSLPFSELEAKLVAGQFGTEPFIGIKASRQVVKFMPASRWIHLATHGVYDPDAFGDGWYSSALLFAGAENWRRTETEDALYGNGVVTADEISRMKLYRTELVVLSACYGGRVDTMEMAGICQGFRAAGVKYMVSALWEVDDIAALIFMAEFYKCLKSRSIPEAMTAARNRLCGITAAEAAAFLNSCRAEYRLENMQGIEEGIQYVAEMTERYGEDLKIYADPYYWSGFVCYQNTF